MPITKTITAHCIGGPAHTTEVVIPADQAELRIAVRINPSPRVYEFRTAVYVRATVQVQLPSRAPDAVPFIFKELVT